MSYYSVMELLVAIGCVLLGSLFWSQSTTAQLMRARTNFARYYRETGRSNYKLFEALHKPLIMGIVYKIVGTVLIFGGFAHYFIQRPANAVIERSNGIVQTTDWEIDNKENFTSKSLSADAFMEHATDGGGELTGNYVNGQLVRIIEKVGLSYGVTTFVYYLDGQSLIFVHEAEEVFPPSADGSTLDHTTLSPQFSAGYYFSNDLVIMANTSGKRQFGDDSAVIADTLPARAKKYFDLLSK